MDVGGAISRFAKVGYEAWVILGGWGGGGGGGYSPSTCCKVTELGNAQKEVSRNIENARKFPNECAVRQWGQPLKVKIHKLYGAEMRLVHVYLFLRIFCIFKGVCPYKHRPSNGYIVRADRKDRYLEGHKVEFRCNANFDMFGERTLHCRNRQWNATRPECKGM